MYTINQMLKAALCSFLLMGSFLFIDPSSQLDGGLRISFRVGDRDHYYNDRYRYRHNRSGFYINLNNGRVRYYDDDYRYYNGYWHPRDRHHYYYYPHERRGHRRNHYWRW